MNLQSYAEFNSGLPLNFFHKAFLYSLCSCCAAPFRSHKFYFQIIEYSHFCFKFMNDCYDQKNEHEVYLYFFSILISRFNYCLQDLQLECCSNQHYFKFRCIIALNFRQIVIFINCYINFYQYCLNFVIRHAINFKKCFYHQNLDWYLNFTSIFVDLWKNLP